MTTTELEQKLHGFIDRLELSDLTKQCLFERMVSAAFRTAMDDECHTDLAVVDTKSGLELFSPDDCAESCMNS